MVFVTGKHYYALARHAEEGSGLPNVAFVRLEQLCPFPTKELQEAVAPFKRAKSEYQVVKRGRERVSRLSLHPFSHLDPPSEFVWSQEEHRNMGAWQFVAPRFRDLMQCFLEGLISQKFFVYSSTQRIRKSAL